VIVKNMMWMIIGAMIFGSGCQTVATRGKKPVSQVGNSIQSVIKANLGQKTTIFDKTGKQVAQLPKNANGSVSIYNKTQNGQDNYTFDDSGVIKKHLCSYGRDYGAGKWKEVK
tara:strand:+ start:2505 stop:2843 length:339 start_codon:yes stop_codon:yes gene_type:complete